MVAFLPSNLKLFCMTTKSFLSGNGIGEKAISQLNWRFYFPFSVLVKMMRLES